MPFYPVFHDAYDSLRFGRVLFVEIADGPPLNLPCRYCDLLERSDRVPQRTMFSAPAAAVSVILEETRRVAPVEGIVFGGPGDPLRHAGIGSILRRIRSSVHLATILLTDGIQLCGRAVRREAGEAHTVVVYLPARRKRRRRPEPPGRLEAWAQHVEAIAALRRETPVRVCVEIPVWPGETDDAENREAWRQAIGVIRPQRIFVIPDKGVSVSTGRQPLPGAAEEELVESLERVGRTLQRRAGVYLMDPTPVDDRCYCER